MNFCFFSGLDEFKAKKDRKRERKQRAKQRKREQKAGGGVGKDRLVETLASKLKRATSSSSSEKKPDFEVITYNDPRKRAQARREERQRQQTQSAPDLQRHGGIDDNDIISMKEARFDVFKLGVKGMSKEDQKDVEIANLVRLGAKPAKNKFVEYSQFKEDQKTKRAEERKRKEEERISGERVNLLKRKRGSKSSTSASESGGAKKKKKSSGENIQTKVGKFDGGMLRISAKELAKIRGK